MKAPEDDPAPWRSTVRARVNQRWLYYDDLMKGYRAWLGGLPPDVARKVAWDNAAALFGVARPAP